MRPCPPSPGSRPTEAPGPQTADKMLKEEDYLGAWLVWTGSSLGLCLSACMLVLWQPAAASSGIPGLIAFLNGAIPIGGKSPLTKKMTGFLSFQTLFAKTAGMILSIPSGLCLGPEGRLRRGHSAILPPAFYFIWRTPVYATYASVE